MFLSIASCQDKYNNNYESICEVLANLAKTTTCGMELNTIWY